MFDGDRSGDEPSQQQVIPAAGTISKFYARLERPAGASGSGKGYTFTVRKNGADTALSCSISETALQCSDTTDSVAFAAGDLITIKAEPFSNPVEREMHWTAVFSPT